jgi:acylphosphatase
MPRERRHVWFSGRVQGVGFRYTCQTLARGFDVTGFVRNLPDGRVELVAEANPSQLEAFLATIQEEMSPYIRDIVTQTEPPAAPPMTGFSIRP